MRRVRATSEGIIVAYLIDRRAQYDDASGIHCAIGELIDGIRDGAHTDAHAYGEYDDILSDDTQWPWRAKK